MARETTQETHHGDREVGARGRVEKERSPAEMLAQNLFLSFRFSQGDAHIQLALFEYIRRLHPGLEIDTALAESMREITSKKIGRFVETRSEDAESSGGRFHQRVLTSSLAPTLDALVKNIQSIFNETVPMYKHAEQSNSLLLNSIAEDIIGRDSKFLSRQEGRDRATTEKEPHSPYKDSYLSHVAHYALRGRPTGSLEFDQLFSEIAQLIRQPRNSSTGRIGALSNTATKELEKVISVYNEHHPESTVFLDQEKTA